MLLCRILNHLAVCFFQPDVETSGCLYRPSHFSPTLKRQAVYIGRRYATCKCHSTYKWRSHDRYMSNWVSTRCDRMRCNKVSTRCEKKCDFTLTGQTARSGWTVSTQCRMKNQLLRFAFPFPLWGKGSGDRGYFPLWGKGLGDRGLIPA